MWKLPADGNSSQNPITLILMHDKSRLNTLNTKYFKYFNIKNKQTTSWNLVGIGNNTSNEMRLSFVESCHQIIQLSFEVGTNSLATTFLFLLTRIFWSFQWLT